MATFKVSTDLPAKRIRDLMITFIESGDAVTGGWCSRVHLKHGTVSERPWYADEALYAQDDFKLEVQETDEDEDEPTLHLIGHAEIQKGLTVMAEKYPSHFADIIEDNEDAATADTFMQCVCFGEEKYA